MLRIKLQYVGYFRRMYHDQKTCGVQRTLRDVKTIATGMAGVYDAFGSETCIEPLTKPPLPLRFIDTLIQRAALRPVHLPAELPSLLMYSFVENEQRTRLALI